MLVTGLLAVQAVLFGAGPIGGIIHVPTDSPTIQVAIEKSQPFDTIIVAPGAYNETINFLGKAITVRSSGGSEATTIDATGIGGSVVASINDEGPDTILDGFTITGGTGRVRGTSSYGGGMFNDEYSRLTVSNCVFRGNTATLGGGMFNNGFTSSPSVRKCLFVGNTANKGGGMYNDVARPEVTDCIFIGNRSSQGGGMYNQSGCPTVNRCVFDGNTVTGDGGGLYNEYGDPALIDCVLTRNTAIGDGGGMFNERNAPQLARCTFAGNIATNGGGMYNHYESSSTLTNCMFRGNAATLGGAMFNYLYSNTSATHCTFSGNSASVGGGIFNSSSYPTIANCILWGDFPREVANRDGSSSTIRYSDVEGGLPGGAIDGGGNLDLDPMFAREPNPGPDGLWDGVDDDYGDLRLKSGSPCIDAGDPDFDPSPGETDLDAHSRLLCGRVDMGAYEFGIGDFDCDRSVTIKDFAAWQDCMTGPNSESHPPINCAAFDFDGDGDVDLLDFGRFQETVIDL